MRNIFALGLGLGLFLGLGGTANTAHADERQEVDALINQVTTMAGEYQKLIYEADSLRASTLTADARKEYVRRVKALMDQQKNILSQVQLKADAMGQRSKSKGILTSFYWLTSVASLILATGFGKVAWESGFKLSEGTWIPGWPSVWVLAIWGVAELISSNGGESDWYRFNLLKILGLEQRAGSFTYERMMKETAFRLAEIYGVSTKSSRGLTLPWRQILDRVQAQLGERFGHVQCQLEFSNEVMLSEAARLAENLARSSPGNQVNTAVNTVSQQQ